MKALIIGSGGREHAMAWRLAQGSSVTSLFAWPGNPGIAQHATCLPKAAYEGIDLVLIGPEAPLMDGLVDSLQRERITAFGPTAAAARLEGSKWFAKSIMSRAGVPTAASGIASNSNQALDLLRSFGYPAVLKADGLAAGKGVSIVHSETEALVELERLFQFGTGILVEEFLTGEEVSYIVISDGLRFAPLLPTQDHKRIFDGDAGPNTGGMGAYCDERILTGRQRATIDETIIAPVLETMAAAGTPFKGFLYAGIMLTAAGPKVLEFNVRLGDPEAQTILFRLRTDLAAYLLETAAHRLPNTPLAWSPDPAVCIVVAAEGYPSSPKLGDEITGLAKASALGATVFHAGTALQDGRLITSGGRVLGVTQSGPTLPQAIENAYRSLAPIHFRGMQFRSDIGRKGLARWPDANPTV